MTLLRTPSLYQLQTSALLQATHHTENWIGLMTLLHTVLALPVYLTSQRFCLIEFTQGHLDGSLDLTRMKIRMLRKVIAKSRLRQFNALSHSPWVKFPLILLIYALQL